MARFLFNCTDDIALPAAYGLIDEAKKYVDKIKSIDVDDNADVKEAFMQVLRNMLVKYPKETSKMLSRLWILDQGETAPNAFETLGTLFSNEVAINFFTSVVPSILSLSSAVSSRRK